MLLLQPSYALTAHKNNIVCCCPSVVKCQIHGGTGQDVRVYWGGSWLTELHNGVSVIKGNGIIRTEVNFFYYSHSARMSLCFCHSRSATRSQSKICPLAQPAQTLSRGCYIFDWYHEHLYQEVLLRVKTIFLYAACFGGHHFCSHPPVVSCWLDCCHRNYSDSHPNSFASCLCKQKAKYCHIVMVTRWRCWSLNNHLLPQQLSPFSLCVSH